MGQPAVYHSLDRAGDAFESPVVTIGNFDGLHRGHRAVIQQALERAEGSDAKVVALTFVPHPVRFFDPDVPPFRLTTDERRFELLLETGVDAVLALEFDDDLAELTPEAFVERIIDDGLGARGVVVGENFRFGKGRAGSTDDLDSLAGGRGIDVDVCDEYRREGDPVSSTRIREALREGDVELAEGLLERPYHLSGRVEHGDKRGRELGYPTANIAPKTLVPAHGIYVTRLHLDDGPALPAATSIGERPTFEDDDAETKVESFVLELDPETDLYGEDVTLEFYTRLRPELEFDSAHRLVEQMSEDVSAVRSYFEKHPA